MEQQIGQVIRYSRRRRFGFIEGKEDIYFFHTADVEHDYVPQVHDIVAFEPHVKQARKVRNAESLFRPSGESGD